VQTNSIVLPLVLGLLAGAIALLVGVILARRQLKRAHSAAARLRRETRAEAESQKQEILVAAQEQGLALEEECDRREHDLEERETRLEQRLGKLGQDTSELGQQRKRVQRREAELERLHEKRAAATAAAEADREEARKALQQIAGMSMAEARAALIGDIEEEARAEGARVARKIEDEARERAEREAVNLITQAAERVNLRDIAESTVSFIELPSDEMKGRIIGKEGRNIRALEMTTGIDLVVDDTPRTILISSFDPIRREVARLAIDRLVEDGRIHPARIEEVVQRARSETEELIEERGNEAAFSLGISDLQPKLARLVGRMRYHTSHGQNLLQHCQETAMIAGYMAEQVGCRGDIARRAGLLHEVGQTDDTMPGQPMLASAELCAKYGEPEAVVRVLRSLDQHGAGRSVEALLLSTANRLSENRPGARKENLAVFIERLRRLENIATSFAGVKGAYAVKAGKEIRVLINSEQAGDAHAQTLSKQIARAVEQELNYPGQIKVTVIRETRSVRFAV